MFREHLLRPYNFESSKRRNSIGNACFKHEVHATTQRETSRVTRLRISTTWVVFRARKLNTLRSIGARQARLGMQDKGNCCCAAFERDPRHIPAPRRVDYRRTAMAQRLRECPHVPTHIKTKFKFKAKRKLSHDSFFRKAPLVLREEVVEGRYRCVRVFAGRIPASTSPPGLVH